MDIANTLEFNEVLKRLSLCAKLEQSRDLCLKAQFFNYKEDISKQLAYTREAKGILDLALELPIDFVIKISDINKSEAYFKEEEIVDFAKTLRTSRLVKNFLKENSENLLFRLSQDLFSSKEIEDRIFETFDSELRVRPDATAELKALYNSLRDSEKNIKLKVNELLNDTNFSKNLQEQIYTTRDDRIVFQVRAAFKSRVDGIIHDVSASSQTFYIEPRQIVSLNNKVRELKSSIHAEIISILKDLTRIIKQNFEQISLTETILSEIDFHFAKARYAIKTRSIEPDLSEEKYIKIESMRHPLLIEYIDNVVENDFEIGKDYKSLIITGSNTGGKTVVIKTIGLFILMLKSGMFLPCASAKLYPFKQIFADIGDEQSIAQSLSTFSSHMTNIIDILAKSDDESFVILDEICAGTDPQEGSVLAQVILEEFAKKSVTSCITTHYGELKTLEFFNPYFKNACVEFDTVSLKPTYKLIIGIPGLSNAILISSNLGMPEYLVEKAKNILISQKDPSIVVVEKLQETQQELSKNLTDAQNVKEQSVSLKNSLEKQLDDVKKNKKKTINIVKNELDSRLEKAKDEIKDILYEIRHEKSEKIARRSYSRLAKLENKMRDGISKFEDKENYEELCWQDIKIGEKVLLKELNQCVVLLSLPDKSGNVFVKMGMIKTKIKKDKLAIFNEKYIEKKPVNKFLPKESFELERRNISNTLDLRGFRVEEALDSVEVFLDKASLVNLTPVYIIHGHGTGALRKAIQDFLSTSPYVAKYRFGEPQEGGDGISVVDIN